MSKKTEWLPNEVEEALVDDICQFVDDPLGYVNYVFPWGEEGTLEDATGPKSWQAQVLTDIGDHLQNPDTRFTPLLLAVASGHGIGKSAMISMVAKWALDTCVDTKIVLTSNTEPQLRTKTLPEMKKWAKMSLTSHWFNATATSFYSNVEGHSDQWRLDAIPWSIANPEAFAGLHNKKKRIVVIFDEGSAIDDKIWEVTEGALTDEDTEIIWLVMGNPTRPNGRFYECFHKYRHRWKTYQIDSRTVEGVNRSQLDAWVADYGEDSDFVKIRVRGIFPSTSALQFIEMELIDQAYNRHLGPEQYKHAEVILTCDPAWTGEDELIIAKRQGLHFEILKIMPKNTNDAVPAEFLAEYEDKYQADAVFIDLGYGQGIYSFGKTWGRDWQLVPFGGKSSSPAYKNKRTQMWGQMREWLAAGGAIPPDPQLRDDLKAPERLPTADGVIALEPKEAIKKRVGFSPNKGDALALSFARPVRKRDRIIEDIINYSQSDYDPLA